jgi:hypothetical protein
VGATTPHTLATHTLCPTVSPLSTPCTYPFLIMFMISYPCKVRHCAGYLQDPFSKSARAMWLLTLLTSTQLHKPVKAASPMHFCNPARRSTKWCILTPQVTLPRERVSLAPGRPVLV